MEELKTMKQNLTSIVQSQMGNLAQVDTKELGEAIDMIKDLAEAIYYCTVTEAMEKSSEDKKSNTYYYTMNYPQHETHYYAEKGGTNMGSSNSNSSSGQGMSSNGSSYYREQYWPQEFRDEREGRSPIQRRMYMETKEMNRGRDIEMKELENYLQDLSVDITDMVKKASPEEKQLLQKKIMGIASKINVSN